MYNFFIRWNVGEERVEMPLVNRNCRSFWNNKDHPSYPLILSFILFSYSLTFISLTAPPTEESIAPVVISRLTLYSLSLFDALAVGNLGLLLQMKWAPHCSHSPVHDTAIPSIRILRLRSPPMQLVHLRRRDRRDSFETTKYSESVEPLVVAEEGDQLGSWSISFFWKKAKLNYSIKLIPNLLRSAATTAAGRNRSIDEWDLRRKEGRKRRRCNCHWSRRWREW